MSGRIHYTSCPACGAAKLRPVFSVADHSVTKQFFELTECGECQLRFTQDAPTSEEAAPYYQFEDYISHTNTRKGIVNLVYQWVRKFTLYQKRKLIEKNSGLTAGTLLDVGCGTGAFAAAMQTSGWQVTALEPDAGARRIALETFGVQATDSDGFFRLPEGHYDVITLWHVLEHMHDLGAVMTQLRKLLKPTGTLFVAVPNYTSYDADVFEACWAAYDVPRHLYHFSPQAMRTLLSSHQLLLTDTIAMWFDSFYVSLLSTSYQSGRTVYGKALLTGLVSNLRALADKERCSSLIYCCRQWPS
ncbi:MAG: class I SAM-dependent methyltransferase [Chitinophagia bacterium]|nr:class I SAM-dependent methyltransferase [Chitinophagia bacterium]